MKLTYRQTIRITSYLLLALVATQIFFTAFYTAEINVPRKFFWGLEGLLFATLAVFAGAAMVQAKSDYLGWSAIAFSAVLNIVQVSIGLTMFGPFQEAASQLEGLAPAAGAVVALSFMIYYIAKFLLGMAAFIFGITKMNSSKLKGLGGLTALIGIVTLFSNGILIIFGRDAFLPSAVAGGSGVLATLLLALCLINIDHEE